MSGGDAGPFWPSCSEDPSQQPLAKIIRDDVTLDWPRIYHSLHKRGPVFPNGAGWVVCGYDECVQTLSDHERYSLALGNCQCVSTNLRLGWCPDVETILTARVDEFLGQLEVRLGLARHVDI